MAKEKAKNEKKGNNKKLVLVIAIAMLLVATVGATFAYYIGSSNISNTLNITTKIENNNGTFVATGSNIELNVTRDLMSESASDDENAIVENNSVLNIEYLSGTDDRIICKYDINYEWVSDNNSDPYSITNNEKKEFTYQIYDSNNIPVIEERNFVSSNVSGRQYLTTLTISNSDKENSTIQQYNIKARFYNLSDDQSSNAGKNWNIKFYVDNVICGIRSDVVYNVLDGNNAEVVSGDNDSLDVRINADYNKFTSGSSVYVDNNLVDPSNYTSESGSTIIKFKRSYLDTLEVGNHIIRVEFNDGGIAEITFSITLPNVEINEPITNETYIGRTLNLSATTNSKNQSITWESDDTSIATVDNNGVVTGVSVGKAKIKAKIGSIESEEIEVNVKTNIYDVNIIDKNTNNETLGTRTDTCTILESKTIEGTTYEGYTSPSNETITCQETNNITLTYSANEYDITVTDTSSNGQLGTRTEKCTYGESTLVPVGSYTGYSSPTAETITCGVTNTKTYTYTPAEYTITVTDKNTDGETLGTRNIACTYGVSTNVEAGSYTGYTSPSSTSTICSTTNNVEMTYTANTYDVVINDVSSNGSTLGTRTESCTYGKSYTPTVTSYTGHTSPSTSSITCNTTNSKTYTYTASTYNVTITDKNKANITLGTRTDTCTYGTSYTPTSGSYTNYNSADNITNITCGTSNNITLSYPGAAKSVTVNYKNTSGSTIATSETKTCTYNESYTISPKTISGYTSPSSYTGTCGETNAVNFSYELAWAGVIPTGNLASGLQSIAGGQKTNSDGAWQVLNETVTINNQNYTNTIYTGANPNNYVRYNGEIWRIIGVYNEDSHGKSGQKLVKIIRNDSLGDFNWDYKQSGVGSSAGSTGSGEWSDSQLMFMLNGNSAINKGKLYNGSPMSTYTTSVSGDYIVDKNNYKIFKNAGSYLDSTKTVYKPARAKKSSLTEDAGTLPSTLSSASQNMIEEVTWHLGGPYTIDDTTKNTASGYYTYERENGVYGGSGVSTTSTIRSTTWEGKIGLMYPSDYGYATNGGSTYSRSTCLGSQMYGWYDESYQTDCAGNSWLWYAGGTSTSKGTATEQWTITPHSTSGYRIFFVNSDGGVNYNQANTSYATRPVLYLKTGVKITSGNGSYGNPYQLSM